MTKTYAIRPLSYSNFTNREFESLMMDTHQSLATFSKANKDEGMYAKHLAPFKTKLDDFQAQLAAVETKESSNLTEVDRNRDSAWSVSLLFIEDLLRLRMPSSKKLMRP